MCSDPETPEPVVEALERIAGGNIVPDEGGTVADEMREIARQALASLTDEPRPTPVPQGLAKAAQALRAKATEKQREVDEERDPYSSFCVIRQGEANGLRDAAAYLESFAALDTQQGANRD